MVQPDLPPRCLLFLSSFHHRLCEFTPSGFTDTSHIRLPSSLSSFRVHLFHHNISTVFLYPSSLFSHSSSVIIIHVCHFLVVFSATRCSRLTDTTLPLRVAVCVLFVNHSLANRAEVQFKVSLIQSSV